MKIFVKTDWNDADYIEHIYDIDDNILNKFLPLIKAVSEFIPYITALGIDVGNHNFPLGNCVRTDLYGKTVYQIYNQFTKEYIDEFIRVFLACNQDSFGMHTICEISNAVTGEIYLKLEPYNVRMEKALNNPVIKAYMAESQQLGDSRTKLCGCKTIGQAGSVQFDKMTPEALAAYHKYKNCWRNYRSDLN